MSVAEQAIADSRRILEADLLDIFFPDAGGNVLAASNADFYNAFLNLVGGGEAYRNRDGSVRQNLSPRIRAAVLAAMLNPERRETVERLLDNPEGYSALINGLMQSAANLAELANKPEYDLSGELSQAVELFVETRDKGQTVDEFAAQTDMFRGAPSAETMFLMRLFEENAKSSGGISGVLRQYAAECKKIDTTTQSLFGEENPTKLEKLEEAYRHYAADLSNEAGNGNLRWRDTGEPTAEEISEAQKQYEEVKSKYMGTPLWMKAPNGKRTNLTEEQWVRVRTPNFKRWFGDWEMLAEAYPEHEIFDIDEAYKFARGNLQGGKFTSKDGHTATLGRSGIDKMNSGLARGKTDNNRLHALAFANVGKLFGNSELLEAEAPRDGDPNIKQYLKFYAPLYMDGRFYVVKITARELYSGNKLYSLEGLDIIEESEYRGQPRDSKENSISADYSDSVKNFVKKIREVKGNVSKVVDENGEPKVVYHGSPYYGFTIFKNESYFTAQKNYAARYKKGGNNSGIYDVFLDIKNPFDTRSKRERDIFEKEFYRKWGNGAPLTERGLPDWTDGSDLLEFIEEKGYNYDGIILDEGADGGYGETVSFRGESYVPLNSTQIKSATDNIGTYSENPDMRWKIDDDALGRIKSLSSADIEGIMDEAERVVSDNLKESKGRSAARVEADREKYIRDNMSKWEEGGEEDYRYYRNPKAYEISESGGEYKVEDDDGNELDFFTELEDAKRYALERRWEDDVYDELDYKEDLYEDNPQNAMRKQFEYALRKIGIEIVNSTGGTFNGSEYIYLELPNGEEKKIRFADHPQVYSADMSVEEDWRAAFKFFVERVQREDWTEENYPDNIRWKIDDPSPERIEKLRADKWAENPKNVEMAAKKYLSRFGEGQIIVDPDEIRKLVPNYDVSDNSAFVAAGDEILEVVWAAALKRTPKDKPVVLLTGNPAAGKGTAKNGGFLDWVDEANLVFDAPQNKFTSVEKRVRETIDAGHRVRIIQVYNDPITSWKNSLKRGIGKDAPKTGKRDGGRFLPMAYFVEAYKNAQGKVEKIESILRQKYQNNLETKYIDNTENNPIVVSPDEAKAWDYSISDSQLKEIERITDENRGRIEESARLRGDKKDPLAIIGRRISQSLAIPIRGSSKGISRRNEQGVDGTEQSLSRQGGERGSSVSRLKSLFRQDRRENPVIWASIVLAKQILLGRAITSARLDRVLPPERFDGTKREYAVNRAREIAERYRSDKEKFGNDLNLGVQRAENDLYWTRDVVEEMYASFRRDGEEYGIARQRLMEWLKEQRRRDLETVKGLSSEELGIDVPAAIEDALEKEPERRKPGKNTAEESGEETFEASGEGIDAEIESAREKPAPSSIRDIIGKIRAGVTKAAKARGMDEAARRRAYRNTLAEVLRESAKRLTYGREREAIMKKISDLSAKGYSVIKIKDGERAGQKIDNYTLRAEHIALRIFNRGVRDTKRELSEKFEKIVSRKGKKPSRMERDDKRALAGAVQMRVYNIKRYSEMDAAELEAEYSATVDRLENVEKNFAERIRHYGAFAKAISKEIRKRAAIVQYGLPPFPASDTIQYRPLCGQSKRRKREQKSSNPKMRCITCESDKTLARLISIKLDLSLYASAPDSYCHASLAA